MTSGKLRAPSFQTTQPEDVFGSLHRVSVSKTLEEMDAAIEAEAKRADFGAMGEADDRF